MSNPVSNLSPARRAVLRLATLIAGRKHGPLPRPDELRRVLLVRYDRLGDAIITTPIVEELQRMAPGCRIDVLASKANAAFYEADPRIDRVWLWGPSLRERARVLRGCRQQRYDATFQLILGETTIPALVAALATPHGQTIGKRVVGHEDLFDQAVESGGLHFAERTFDLLRNGVAGCGGLTEPRYSIVLDDDTKRSATELLAAAGLPPGGYIMVNISSGSSERELADEQNVELATTLRSGGFRVGVMGAPTSWERVAAIASAAGAAALRFPRLLDAAAAIAEARAIVTPDTSIVHVASAVGTPTVAFYTGSVDPIGWGPRGVPYRTVRTTAPHASALATADVIAALNELSAQI